MTWLMMLFQDSTTGFVREQSFTTELSLLSMIRAVHHGYLVSGTHGIPMHGWVIDGSSLCTGWVLSINGNHNLNSAGASAGHLTDRANPKEKRRPRVYLYMEEETCRIRAADPAICASLGLSTQVVSLGWTRACKVICSEFVPAYTDVQYSSTRWLATCACTSTDI